MPSPAAARTRHSHHRTLAQAAPAPTAPAGLPSHRGGFAFHYAGDYSQADINWYGRFSVLVPHDFLPPDETDALHQSGTKLLLYEWFVAYYGVQQEYASVLHDHPEWLLNSPEGLLGEAGDGVTPAHYFDLANPELRAWRVRLLVTELHAHHYDGLFFDTTGFASVHTRARARFEERHPGVWYDRCAAAFLKELRAADPNLIIFTNQGYRDYADYLPAADYDLTESYMTTTEGPHATAYVEGKGVTSVQETYFHPWDDPAHPWDSVAHYCEALICQPMQEHGYHTRICHLNYGQPHYVPTGATAEVDGKSWPVMRPELDREALYYGYACAALLGHEDFYEDDTRRGEDPVYFADLGPAVDATYHYDRQKGLAWRCFQHGIVLVNDGSGDRSPSPAALGLTAADYWDVFTGQRIAAGQSLPVPASHYTLTHRVQPSGRVFMTMPAPQAAAAVRRSSPALQAVQTASNAAARPAARRDASHTGWQSASAPPAVASPSPSPAPLRRPFSPQRDGDLPPLPRRSTQSASGDLPPLPPLLPPLPPPPLN